MELEVFVRGLPKAELHLHIEGTLEPELMIRLAARNGIDLPYESVEAVRTAYEFNDLQSFLDIYYQGAAVLQREEDFADLMSAYLARAAADGVRHAEIFFDAQTHTERGLGFEVFMPGFARAQAAARRELGISSSLILCFLRHLNGTAALKTWESAEPFRNQLVAVGLDSAEVGNPPDKFLEVFTAARAAGFHAVAHAGEEGPPEYVTGALDVLGAERIDHGVRAEEDPSLLRRLVDTQVPLTVCPLSNLKLRVVDRLEDHNLKRLLNAGVKVTINSDDPAYFGGYIADNYLVMAAALGLSREQLVTIARNSIEATFLEESAKAGLLAELDAFVAASHSIG